MSGRWGFVFGDTLRCLVSDGPVLLAGFFAGLLDDAAFLVVADFFLGCLSSGFLGGMLRS